MRVVALDTCTAWGGIALVEGGGAGTSVVGEAGLLLRGSHAAHVLAVLDCLMAEAGWPRSAVDLYAATRGPGSFTGIRVGLGTVRGLGVASGRPCLGIVTLEAMAEAFGAAEGERVPLLDAGRGEVFGARYDARSSPPVETRAPWLGPPEEAVAGTSSSVVIFGPGAVASAERLREAGLAPDPRPVMRSAAAAAARLALARLEAGADDGEGLSPLYLRPPDAELAAPRDGP